MVQKQKQIERNDALDLDAAGERKLEEERAVAIVMEDLARKTYGEIQESTLEEETTYKHFFIDCGIDTEANINTIFQKIADQTRNTKDLTKQRDILRREIAECKAELTSMTSCITERGFSSPRAYVVFFEPRNRVRLVTYHTRIKISRSYTHNHDFFENIHTQLQSGDNESGAAVE